jgi:hypothetical protein
VHDGTPRPPPIRVYSTADTLIMAWPYWLAVIAAVFAMFVLLFAVLSVVAAIT